MLEYKESGKSANESVEHVGERVPLRSLINTESAEVIDSYLHTYSEYIKDQYLEDIYKLGF